MATRNTDVNLIIRARTEGEKAVAALADLVKSLGPDASSSSTGVAELGKALAELDKSAAKLGTAQEKVTASASKQAAAVHASAAGIAEQQDRVETLSRALGILAAEADKAFVGPKRDGLADMVRSTKAQLSDAQRQVDRYTAAYERNLAGLRASRSGLLDLQRSAATTADAQHTAAAGIENATRAMNEQVVAGERVTEMQRRINALTGVDRPDTTGSAAAAANTLLEADNIYRRAKAREAEITKLREQEAATAALADAEQRQRAFSQSQGVTADPKGAAARQSAQAFIEAADAEEQMNREAKQLLDTVDPLAAIQERYNASLVRYRELAGAGKLTTDQLAAAEAHLATEATKAREALQHSTDNKKIGAFGLKPYELQNLGYQVNDVVTQLASGTSLARTLGQQGGQIAQIFPRVTSAIAGAFTNPAILSFIAAVGGLVILLKQADDRAERLRDITSTLKLNANGDQYDAKSIAKQAEDLEDLGAKAKDATAAMKVLIEQGIVPDRLAQFGKAAQDTAISLGTDLPEAAREVADAFTGGYDAVAKLDDKLNFLSGTEREHIRQLFESGNADAARTEALNAYSRAADAAAKAARGPWSDAWLALKKAGGDGMKWLADTAPIKATIAVFNELAGVVKELAEGLSALTGGDAAGPKSNAQQIAETQDQIRKLTADIANMQAQAAKSPKIAGTFNHLIDESKRQLAAAQAQLGQLEGKAADTVNNGPNSARAKDRADTLSQIGLEAELQKLRDQGAKGLSDADAKRREYLAGQLAYTNSIKQQGDQIIAQRLREQAIAHETAETNKQNLAARKRAIEQFEGRVIGAEGGSGKNKAGSSAAGFGQFLPQTYLTLFKQTYGSKGLSDQEILATRYQESIAKGIIDAYTRQNAAFLDRIGAKVTAGNLYLTHFFGATPLAKQVLNPANDQTPVDDLVNRYGGKYRSQILSKNQSYLRTDGGKGAYRTAAQLRTFLAGRVGEDGDVGTAQSEGENALNNELLEGEKRQRELNLAIKEGNDERTRSTDALREENGLYGTALLAEQRRQAIIQAEAALRKQVDDKNKDLPEGDPRRVSITDQQVADVRRTTADQFDQSHLRDNLTARLADVQRPVDDLAAQKDLLQQQAEFLKSIGDNDGVEEIHKQIDALTPSIQAAYDKLIEFYRALTPEQRVDLGILDQRQLDTIIDKLGQAKQASQEWGRVMGVSAKDVAQSFASSATSAVTNLINKLAAGQNVFKSLSDGVREFAANFISSIAQMILQAYAFAGAMALLRFLGVPVPSSITVGQHHTGGIAGEGGSASRSVAPAWFAGAMRYHTGGVAGLAPDEVPAILRRGEEVLTANDPRHRANGGGLAPAGSPLSVKNVNVFDSADMLVHALSTKQGEKVLINHVRSNSRAYKSAIAA